MQEYTHSHAFIACHPIDFLPHERSHSEVSVYSMCYMQPAVKKTPISLPKVSDAKELTVAELDSCLDQFVNRVFKFPTNGKPLNTFCKDPRVLW